MSLDRQAAERRRFARLLGTAEHGVGLPVGPTTDEETDDRKRE
ncbi:hypothetical protein ACYJ1Y_06645 [Natrialbaceae archaeon A-gly3]